MIPPISEQNTFVVGKLPPNTVLVVKRQPKLETSEAEKEQVERLKERDIEVRSHEAAHAHAAGANTIAKKVEVEIGPDGKPYAKSGETVISVKADISEPEQALAEAQQLRQAAHAADTPSTVDLSSEKLASEIENKALKKAVEIKLPGSASPEDDHVNTLA